MKKKLIQMTADEIYKICQKNILCKECPFRIDNKCGIYILSQFMKREIEVDVEE